MQRIYVTSNSETMPYRNVLQLGQRPPAKIDQHNINTIALF